MYLFGFHLRLKYGNSRNHILFEAAAVGAGRIFGRSNIWSLRPCVYTGPAKRPQIRPKLTHELEIKKFCFQAHETT